MEIAEKVRRVLEIFESLNGELPNDTYLEKTIDGLAQILQDPMVSQDFYPKSGIEEFTFRHFNSISPNFSTSSKSEVSKKGLGKLLVLVSVVLM